MDAYQLYYNFISGKQPLLPQGHPKITDPRLIQLLALMQPSQLKEEDRVSESQTVSSTSTVESPSTRPNTPTGPGIEELFSSLGVKDDVVHQCDTIMAGRSKPRLDALVRHADCFVNMMWVYSFASRVESETEVQQDRYENLVSDSNRHVHIISNDILYFLKCLGSAESGSITTFAWSSGSKNAIHLQKFKHFMETKFKTDVLVSTTVIASIGLPLHELIKVVDYLRFTRRRGNVFTNANIVKTLLRKKLKIEKISTSVEENQLIEEYQKNKDVFEVNETYSDVHMFMFKHWYSYPTAEELRYILERAIQNVARWSTNKK